MSRLLRVLVSLVPLLLTACPPVTLKTVTLFPTRTDGLNGSWQSQYSDNAYCYIPAPGSGLGLGGLGPEGLSGGEIYAGYEDIFYPGAQPFPCNVEKQFIYRGHVMFDFSQFDAIGAASLQYDVAQSENTSGGAAEIPPNSYATILGMSTGLINGDNGPYYWNFDDPVSLPTCNAGIIKPDCTIDVSSQARMWTSGAHPAYGFMFAGPILNLANNPPQDNNAALTWYNNFQVVVTYNPAMNPRAPQ